MSAAPTIRTSIDRVDAELVQAAKSLSTATLHEAAGKIGALPSAIKPLDASTRVCGAALTVDSPGGDNLWLHRAIYAAQPGDVLVVRTAGNYEYGYWGEIMSTAAAARGITGLVIDACVRDGTLLPSIGLPVFSRGLCIRGTGKDFGATGWINAPLLFDHVIVHPGDLIVGDADGVVCLPRQQVAAILRAASNRDRQEAAIIERLKAGETTLEIYGWN
jgi:4-hydroxy-4-methyl-2-oxoglutarate aldolase